jgi:hypothetical protein
MRIADDKVWAHRSHRVLMRYQAFSLPHMFFLHDADGRSAAERDREFTGVF